VKIKEKFYVKFDEVPVNEIPTEFWLERFRNWRAIELSQSDWTQLPDSPADKTSWAEYRQALRDLPAAQDFANADVPSRPE